MARGDSPALATSHYPLATIIVCETAHKRLRTGRVGILTSSFRIESASTWTEDRRGGDGWSRDFVSSISGRWKGLRL